VDKFRGLTPLLILVRRSRIALLNFVLVGLRRGLGLGLFCEVLIGSGLCILLSLGFLGLVLVLFLSLGLLLLSLFFVVLEFLLFLLFLLGFLLYRGLSRRLLRGISRLCF